MRNPQDSIKIRLDIVGESSASQETQQENQPI